MINLSNALQDLIDKDAFLCFGLQHKLLNLSQTAKFLVSILETRTKKEVTISSILMNLSRLQRVYIKKSTQIESIKIKNLTIHSNISSVTFFRDADINTKISQIYKEVQSKNGYMTINQGMNEVTILIEESMYLIVKKYIQNEPKFYKEKLAALGIQFDEKYINIPGLIYFLVQQISLQNINISEVTSTYTEIVFYVDQQNIRLAFDTIYNRFLQK